MQSLNKHICRSSTVQTKKGQVTIFVVIGIVALFAILFIIFAKDLVLKEITKATNVEKRLQYTIDEIKEKINACTQKETTLALQQLGDGGGTFEPYHYLTYYGKKFTYLCTKLPGQPHCAQQLVSKYDLQKKLDARLQEKIRTCINLNAYRNKDYTLTTGTFALTTTLFPKNILINITYPITLTKDSYTAHRTTFNVALKTPLGSILDAVHDILNAETTDGYFDPLMYSFIKRSTYDIERRIPYPDVVYIVKLYGYDYHFQFAIERTKKA